MLKELITMHELEDIGIGKRTKIYQLIKEKESARLSESFRNANLFLTMKLKITPFP